jgi:AraC-like DNA-binding protein
VGQLQRPIAIEDTGHADCLGIRLHPAGAAAFLGFPAVALTDQIMTLDALLPDLDEQIVRWMERPCQLRSVEALEQILLNHVLHTTTIIDPIVERAVSVMSQGDGAATIHLLAAECALSTRQFERRFTRVVGLAPKLFARVLRFRRVCRAATSSRPRSWATIAAQHGYADQSHLIREFQSFAGDSPTRVFSKELYDLMLPGRSEGNDLAVTAPTPSRTAGPDTTAINQARR